MEYNSYLTVDGKDNATKQGGAGYIESPGDKFMNMIWQTRQIEPSAYERKLCETLSMLFAQGAQQLEEIVQGLNDTAVRPPSSERWTEENFRLELKRLGRADTDPV